MSGWLPWTTAAVCLVVGFAGGGAIAAYNRLVKLYYNPGETVQGQATS